MTRPSLRAALNAGEFVLAPGIHDMIAAVISNKIGFDFVYGSGFWTTASAYGLPDAGIATYTQMLDRMATLTRTVRASVIADADTGYGGLLNVHHTVRGYEAAGVTAIQIEDQEFPKKCGHTPFKRVVPVIDMVEKVKVACEARANPEETHHHRPHRRPPDRRFRGRGQARYRVWRGRRRCRLPRGARKRGGNARGLRRISKPMMANMADGGKTPIYSKKELAALGYKLAIFPSITGLAAAAAIEKALVTLKTNGTSNSPDLPLFDFREFNGLIGFEEVWEFERRWARNIRRVESVNPSAVPVSRAETNQPSWIRLMRRRLRSLRRFRRKDTRGYR